MFRLFFIAFLDKTGASQLLSRQRRANSLFEEVKQGNMERECNEEHCSKEEAREIFEDDDQTNEFWAIYYDGDACKSTPCVNKGRCKDGIGSYTCFCLSGYQGFNCEIVIPQLCENENGGCEHFCKVVRGNVRCSCADGYELGPDDKSCQSNETFRCGGIITENVRTILRYRPNTNTNGTKSDNSSSTNSTEQEDEEFSSGTSQRKAHAASDHEMSTMTRIVNGEDCPPGECPWQAVLLNEEHHWFCGGTILNPYIILTAAHCMNETRYFYIRLGESDMLENEGTEAMYEVETILAHYNYKPNTYHNDIALIKLTKPIKYSRFILPACIPEQEFAESVLMQQSDGMISGFGRLGGNRQTSPILKRLTIPYVERRTCMESTSLRISARMFCAGYDEIAKDACQGDSGGPHVTRYRSTYFITGIVSWGEGCAQKGKYGVYTQVSKYIRWIRDGINTLIPKGQSTRLKRHYGPIRRIVG
ncbi:coagulation factor X [Takifugu rubripes]|uniref:coagulation factor Xa n=1 Tax=Takifugu rubripes TaxID=31033 RepID=Q804W9_TAKRU|nr:coagulation factor X [Takifugu rubripes]AAO33371.1 coagulation factor X precursor [Takifugu rubripes]|eukprot:NP_001027783.1 coagulation factor X [Takifugu rubripes]